MPPQKTPVKAPTKAAGSVVPSSKSLSTPTPPPAKAPTKAAAPVIAPSKPVSAPTLTKQPQAPAPAGKWAQKLPALASSASATNAPAPVPASVGNPQPTVAQPSTPSASKPVPGGTSNTSSTQGASLDANGILTFGDGLLDLVKGYEYNEEQIMTFLNGVFESTKPTRVARDVAKGIQTFLLTANNNTTKILATWEYPKDSNDKRTEEQKAQPLKEASEAQLQGPNSLASVPSIPTRDSPLRQPGTSIQTSKDVKMLDFQGVSLPMVTIYDYLAWLLSVLGSSETQGVEKTAQNYYLPLLALFSRWCTIVSNLIKFESLPMVHISWWDNNVLLGATLGDVPEVPGQHSGNTKQTIYVAPRQTILNGLEFRQPPLDEEGKQNYGRCAETFLFIVAKRKKLSATSVQGFAMMPPNVEELPINQAIKSGLGHQQKPLVPRNETSDLTYQKFLKYQTSSLYLVNPCGQSCQNLFKQIRWDWMQGFDVNHEWKKSVGVALDRKAEDPNKPRSTPETLGVGGKGEGDFGRKPPDLVGREPFNANVSANLTPGQRLGNTQAVKDQNRKTVGKTSAAKSKAKLTAGNVTAAAGNPTPGQMVGSTVATIAGSAVSAAAPAILTHVAGMYGK